MEAIHVRQRLRPIRYAFILNDGDLDALLTAVCLNTVLWGGIYNPIVPLTPADTREDLLAGFDPDAIVDLTGGRLDAELAERFRFRTVTPADFVDTHYRTGKRRLGFGFSMLPILREIHTKEVRHSAEPTRAALVRTDAADGWPEYVSVVFGSFARLPETGVDFEAIFRRALRARDLAFDPGNIADQFGDILSPVETTGYHLRVYSPPASLSSHVVCVGDHRHWADLVAFWNLRASGRTVLFLPVEGHDRHAALVRPLIAAGRYPINPQIENEPDIQKAPSLDPDRFQQACRWIETLEVGRLRPRASQPDFSSADEFYVGDLHACELEANSGEEVSLLENNRMTPVKLLSPDQLDEERTFTGDYEWAVDVTMSGGPFTNDYAFAFPSVPTMDRVVRRVVLGGMPPVRVGRHGVVTIQNSPRATLHLLPIETQTVFAALFEHVGLKMEPSQPGRYATEIIRKMGGNLHFDCRVFKIQGVRAAIDQLSSGGILRKGNIVGTIRSRDNWRADLYTDLFIHPGETGPVDVQRIFDLLLEKRIIRPGLTLQCAHCSSRDWYHVSEFAEEYTCRFCFTEQRVSFGTFKDWHYKADGLFQIRDSALGSLAVIVSLWRFADLRSGSTGRYQTCVTLTDPATSWKCEVDYLYLEMGLFGTSYELVIGQAANQGDFTATDTANMAALADRFQKRPWLAFSTLKERFSDAEKKHLLNELVARDYRVIPLTRLELDPYHLYNRFADAPHRHAVSLRHFSDNTRALNLP
jgi:hypothetical protein